MRTSPLLALLTVALLITSHSASQATTFQDRETNDTTKGTSTWTVDNEHTSLVCAASHYGLSFVYGRFNKCSGTIKMDFQDPNASDFRFEIDPDSVDTNNASRDIALRGPQCLDAAQYKSISFESTSVKTEDQPASTRQTKRIFQVTGNLTLHGETRQVTIPMELLAMGNGPDGKMRCGFMARFVVNRSDFGIDNMKDSVGDSIAVTFCFQTVHQDFESEEDVEALDFKTSDSADEFGKEAMRENLIEITGKKAETDPEELFEKD